MAQASSISSQNSTGVVEIKPEQQGGESLTSLALRRLRRDYLTLGAMIVLFFLGGMALFAPVITSILDINPNKTNPYNNFRGLGAPDHLLGTDEIGRDHLARLIFGGQVSLGIAFASAFISLAVGMAIGVIAGYYQGGRWGLIDDVLMWFVTTLNSMPTLFMLIVIAALLSPGVSTLIIVLSLVSWSGTMRFVRGETLSHREREYIVSAQALGASPWRIMFVHILPNTLSILIIDLASTIAVLILVESALSFLNLGVSPPTPTWGNMLTKSRDYYTYAPHLVFAPGILIFTTVLSLYLIGDGLRDALDPQAKNKKI